MNASSIFSLLISLFFIVSGILAAANGTLRGDYSQYTKESVKKYSKIHGIIFIIVGVFFTIGSVLNIIRAGQPSDTLLLIQWICYGLGLLVVIVFLCLRRKFLVKK